MVAVSIMIWLVGATRVQGDPVEIMIGGALGLVIGLAWYVFYKTPAGQRFTEYRVRPGWRWRIHRTSVQATPIVLMCGGLLFLFLGLISWLSR
jgi:hypothetical protein